MTPALATLLSCLYVIGAFLLGGFPTGPLVARARGVDLRKVGSGNVGATNVGRALGRGYAALVLLVDAAKGFVPVWLVARLDPPVSLWVVAGVGLAAILGHSYSLFLRGKGGKGVATSFGAALAIYPLAAVAAAVLYAAVFAVFRISSVGSLMGVWAFPALMLVFSRVFTYPLHPAYLAFGVATALLVTVRHRDNIRRLLRGEELKA